MGVSGNLRIPACVSEALSYSPYQSTDLSPAQQLLGGASCGSWMASARLWLPLPIRRRQQHQDFVFLFLQVTWGPASERPEGWVRALGSGRSMMTQSDSLCPRFLSYTQGQCGNTTFRTQISWWNWANTLPHPLSHVCLLTTHGYPTAKWPSSKIPCGPLFLVLVYKSG